MRTVVDIPRDRREKERENERQTRPDALIARTHQSMITDLVPGIFSWITLAATATLLKKQKPMCSSGSAWWPGGRTMAKALRILERGSMTASAVSMTPPQESLAASVVAGQM